MVHHSGYIHGAVQDGEQGTYDVYIGVKDKCSPNPQADAKYIWEIF